MRDFLPPQKPLGKGVEDISHFFLSPAEVPSIVPASPNDSASPKVPGMLHRIIAVVSETPRIPTLFWSSQLASVLSQAGKKVMIIDVGTEPGMLADVFHDTLIHPSLNDLLNQADKSITVEGPGGFRILGFQIHLDELRQFKPEELEILFQILRKEEQEVDIVLLNIRFDFMQVDTDIVTYLQFLHESILVVSPEDLLGSYRLLKVLYKIQPGLTVGIMECGSDQGPYHGGIQRLVMASKEFLNKSPAVLGGIEGSVRFGSNGGGLPTLHQGSSQQKAMVGIGKRILQGFNGGEGRGLFFEFLQTKF